MMQILFLIASISSLFIVGFIYIQSFNLLKNSNFIETLGYSYGVGIGVITFQMFVYSLLHIPWNLFFIVTPHIFLGWRYKTHYMFKPVTLKTHSRSVKVLLVLSALLFIFVTVESVLRPLTAWDGWATWMFRAKIFYHDGFINPAILRTINLEYPVLVSLLGTYIYLFLQAVNDRLVLLLYPLFYLASSLILYSGLKKESNSLWASIGLFFYMSMQDIIRHAGRYDAGQADLSLSYFILGACVLLRNYTRNQDLRLLILVNIFSASAALTKNEGIPFFIIMLLVQVVFLIQKHTIKSIFISLFSIVPVSLWIIFKYINRLPLNYHLSSFSSERIMRVGDIAILMGKEFLNISHWNLLWIVFFIAFIINFYYQTSYRLLSIIIILQLIVYAVIFIITPYEIKSYIPNVIDRLYMHLAAISLFVTILTCYSKTRSKTKLWSLYNK